MLIGLVNAVVFLLVNGLVLYSSWCLANYLLRDHPSLPLRMVATGILSFVHATLVILFLGVIVRTLNAWSVPLLSLVVSALTLWCCRACRQPLIQPVRLALAQTFAGRDYALFFIAGLFVLQVMVLLFKVVWLPPHVWDVFVYHLPPAVQWYQQGYIPSVLDTTVNRINGAPLGMTVLAYWFFIFFRDDALVELPMLLWALLLVPVSFAVLRQSGVSRPWALKFAVLIFFIPIVLLQAVTVKDHLGLNVGLVAGLLFLSEFIKTREYNLLLLAAAAFGLILGYKVAAPVHILVALAVFCALLWFRQRDALLGSQQRRTLIKAVGRSAVLVVIIGGYWYMRNLLVYGRLQGAYGLKLSATGEHLSKDGGAVDAVINKLEQTHNIQSNIVDFLPRVFDYQNYYSADLISISGYGPQFATFGLLALIVAIAAFFNKGLRQQPVFLLSSVAVLLFAVLMFINYNSNSYRILSFFPMILIAYAGVQLYQRGWLARGGTAVAVDGVVLLSILWCGAMFLPPQMTNLMRFHEFVTLDAADRTTANYTRWFVSPRPNFYWLLSEIPDAEPIAHVAYRSRLFPFESAADTWSYLYVDRHWRRRIYSLHLPEYFDCKKTVCEVKPVLKSFMQTNRISLLSSCKLNHCLTIRDADFFELMPGFYYFRGAS